MAVPYIRKLELIRLLREAPVGVDLKFICQHLGIHRATVYRWMQKDPEFKSLIEKYLDKKRIPTHHRAMDALVWKAIKGSVPAIKHIGNLVDGPARPAPRQIAPVERVRFDPERYKELEKLYFSSEEEEVESPI